MGASSQQEQTTERKVPGAGGQETALMNLFQQLAQAAGGQMGDLSALAQGQLQGPTQADRDLVQQSIGASTDIARRELEQQIQSMMSGLDEELAARGLGGSSIEAVKRGQVYGQGVNQIANLLSQQQAQSGQALMNLPFQRAQTQLGANQALMQRLTGTGAPVLNSLLSERLNQGTSTTTQTQTPGFLDWVQAGAQTAQAVRKPGGTT